MEPSLEIFICHDIATFRMLNDIFVEEFNMPKDSPVVEDLLQQLLDDPRFAAVVCKIEGKIVGGATLYVLPSYLARKPVAYLYDVAITAAFQGRGIGRRLIEFVKEKCLDIGASEVFVQSVRGESAVDFYRSTRPDEEIDVKMFVYQLDTP